MNRRRVAEMWAVMEDVVQSTDPNEGLTRNMLFSTCARKNPIFYDANAVAEAWEPFKKSLEQNGSRHHYVTNGQMRKPADRKGAREKWEATAKPRIDLDDYQPYSVRLKEEISRQDYLGKRRRPGDGPGEPLWSQNVRDLLSDVANDVYTAEQEIKLLLLLKGVAADLRDSLDEVSRLSLDAREAKDSQKRTINLCEGFQKTLLLRGRDDIGGPPDEEDKEQATAH